MLNIIRDTLRIVDHLQDLAEHDALTPELFRGVEARILGNLEEAEHTIRTATATANRAVPLQLVAHVDHLVCRMRTKHGLGQLDAAQFEARITMVRQALKALDAWACDAPVEYQAAPRALPLCQGRFVDQGPRHFTVFEGGRA